MKWLALIAIVLAVHPLGHLARTRPRWLAALAVALGFLPFYAVDVNLLSYESYRGDTRGLELSLADFVAYALLVGAPTEPHAAPFRWSRRAYVAVAVVSVALAQVPLFAAFAVFKLLRCSLLFAAVFRVAAGPARLAPFVLKGMAAGVTYAAGLALWQRYGLSYMQVPGPFAHQNGLAMAANMVFPTALAIALAGQGGRLAPAAVAASAVAVVLTLSRGGMVMFCIAAGIVFVGSLLRRPTAWKAKWLGGLVAGGALVLVKSWDTIVERFSQAAKSSEEAREHFEAASALMLADHPLGVGMNQYSRVLEYSGYGERLGMDPNDCSGIVHNIYWLTLSELGYQGLAAFVLLLAAPLVAALRGARADRTIVGDVLLGIAASLVVTYLQGKLEWALRMTAISQLLWISFALVAALALPPRASAS